LLAFCNLSFAAHAQSAATAFALHDGDRVTFYGDSITDQREYTEDVEEFVLTRYPAWKVSFHNAGVGGDKSPAEAPVPSTCAWIAMSSHGIRM